MTDELLLIAFVPKDLKENQALGWNIIHDKEIIDEAKRRYLLVTLDVNNFRSPPDLPELDKIISQHKKSPFFVIVNSALYPISHWAADEDKEFVISRLVNGNGP